MKVGIYGASGYTGQELLRILLNHPHVEVTAVTSRQYKGMAVSDLYPVFTNRTNLVFLDASPEEVAAAADIIFLALPHGGAMKVASIFLDAGKKVVDLSADFRLRKVETFEAWYEKHGAPGLIKEAVYGIPELYRNEIRAARFVANPGCYPTSIILGFAPLLKNSLIDTETLIADSKSGVSGAGREAQIGSLFCEVDEGFKAYKVGQHRHTPEIEQELGVLAGREILLSFTPHLLPVNRGILSTLYARLTQKTTTAELLELFRRFYEKEPFVRIYREGSIPNISSVKGTNFCDIGVVADGRTGRVIVLSAIDNLVKGASGQAVQNMNLMCGFPEGAGLGMLSVFP
ncbi:MAG: N-acetyl-gamma-glutamyl-phosphate reductase [Deltaproteobacteria bacterium HGW-Deltaproteobacteria-19]|jgi:N-acetyl-gamma-glutamyl-phosphate reductase|nr:MAG: N-acetyl-gamma-glutamyl-phosphate reductase [Deltaproteobacteria bacterium HGW-Deltaproteobacteria-19]